MLIWMDIIEEYELNLYHTLISTAISTHPPVPGALVGGEAARDEVDAPHPRQPEHGLVRAHPRGTDETAAKKQKWYYFQCFSFKCFFLYSFMVVGLCMRDVYMVHVLCMYVCMYVCVYVSTRHRRNRCKKTKMVFIF